MLLLSSERAVTRHSPERLFAAWADPASWPAWDSDLRWVRFEGPVVVGARGVVKSTSGPPLRFVVSEVDRDRVFTNTGTLPGARLVFEHRVAPTPTGSEAVVTIALTGSLSWLWQRIMGAELRGAAASSLGGLLAHLDEIY